MVYFKGECGADGDNLTWTLEDGVLTIKGCTSLTEITIPKSVTSIMVYAFSNCSSLQKITVDPQNSVYTEKGNCLINTTDGTLILGCSNSVIPTDNSIRDIGYGAFSGCTGLTEITIPDSVTSIAKSAFEGCTGLTEINIPESVTIIEGSAFEGCSSLTNITIPKSVTSIGDKAFWYCSSLTKITISEGVTSIGNEAFFGCSSLTEITIPKSIKSIGEVAFYGCDNLKAAYYPGTEEEWKAKVTVAWWNDDLLDHLIFGSNGPSVTPGGVGDADGNGRLTSADRTYLARALAGWGGYAL